MLDSFLKRNKQSEFDSQRVTPQEIDDQRYWKVRGSNGRIVVDIEKVREAMRYAMEQHAKARRKERLENLVDVP